MANHGFDLCSICYKDKYERECTHFNSATNRYIDDSRANGEKESDGEGTGINNPNTAGEDTKNLTNGR